MSRLSIVPGAVLAASVLAPSGCGGGATASKASTTSATATTSTSDAPSSAPSSTTKSAPTASADSLAALAPAAFGAALLTSVQIANFAPDMSRYTDSEESNYSGEGGTCPALARYLGSSDVLPGAAANSQYVSYDNSDVAQSAAQVRGVDQIIESHPDSDPATDLATYRKAIAGCTSALIGDDGSRNTVALVSAPSGYGSSALAFQLTGTSGGERSVADFVAVVSGKNVVALATGGFSAAQRARILAQAWKNLTSATSSGSAPTSSGGSI